MNKRKLLKKLLSGSRNLHFSEVDACAKAFGFVHDRTRGVPSDLHSPCIARIIESTKCQRKSKALSSQTATSDD